MKKIVSLLTFIFLLLSCGPKPGFFYAVEENVVHNISGKSVRFIVRDLEDQVWASAVMNDGDRYKLDQSISYYYDVYMYFDDEVVLHLKDGNFKARQVEVGEFDILNIYEITEYHYNLALKNTTNE